MYCLLLILFCLFFSSIYSSLTPVVDLPYGPVQGAVTEYEGIPYYKFLGIPYAKPPIGPLRLQLPVDPDPWNEVKLVTEFGSPCEQFDQSMLAATPSEDCLYLNVYVSESAFYSSDITLRPVLFWIHGGSFLTGSGSLSTAESPLVPLEDVILVTINYRLNAFGFMYFGPDEPRIPPNIGLKDQLFALKWVKENIFMFGGDPDLITIFGQSAGGISVSALLISPLTKGLFKRAIIESGTVYTKCGNQTRLIEDSWDLYNKTSCAGQQDILTCLQNLEPDELLSGQKPKAISFLYTPGGDLLPNEPCEAIAEGNYDNTPELMLGVEKNEASFFMPLLDPIHFQLFNNPLSIQYEDALRIMSKIFDAQSVDHAVEIYFNSNETENSDYLINRLERVFSDVLFVCPTYVYGHQYATTNENGGKVYAYYHTQRPSSFSPLGEWTGTHHGAEQPFVFGHPLNNSDYTERDAELSRQMMKIWTHFAEKGEPPIVGATRWLPLQEDSSAMIMNIDDWGKADTERIQFCREHWPFILQHRKTEFESILTGKQFQ